MINSSWLRQSLYTLFIFHCCLPAASADLVTGKLAYEAKHYETALENIKPLAEAGDASAEYYLALIRLYSGDFGNIDAKEGAKYIAALLISSARKGNILAQTELNTHLGYLVKFGLYTIDSNLQNDIDIWFEKGIQGHEALANECNEKSLKIMFHYSSRKQNQEGTRFWENKMNECEQHELSNTFFLVAKNSDGYAPLEVRFYPDITVDNEIKKILLDYENDGTIDKELNRSPSGGISHSYDVGSHIAKVVLVSSSGNERTAYHHIEVRSAKDEFEKISKVMENFITNLESGDPDGARNYFANPRMFDQKIGSTSHKKIASVLREQKFVAESLTGNVAQFVFIRNNGGQNIGSPVMFVRTPLGKWLIEDM